MGAKQSGDLLEVTRDVSDGTPVSYFGPVLQVMELPGLYTKYSRYGWNKKQTEPFMAQFKLQREMGKAAVHLSFIPDTLMYPCVFAYFHKHIKSEILDNIPRYLCL